jgi:hypothetical protein
MNQAKECRIVSSNSLKPGIMPLNRRFFPSLLSAGKPKMKGFRLPATVLPLPLYGFSITLFWGLISGPGITSFQKRHNSVYLKYRRWL